MLHRCLPLDTQKQTSQEIAYSNSYYHSSGTFKSIYISQHDRSLERRVVSLRTALIDYSQQIALLVPQLRFQHIHLNASLSIYIPQDQETIRHKK